MGLGAAEPAVSSDVALDDVARDDVWGGLLAPKLDPQIVRELSRLSPLTSSLQIAAEWLSIFAAALVCQRFNGVFWYALAVVFIGARQHALLVLAHDAAHYRLFRNRDLNDWLGELLLAWPFVLVTMHAYRRNHFAHHRFVNTADDPDWRRKQTNDWKFPMSTLALARMLLGDALGIGFIKFAVVAARLPKPPATELTARDRRFARARMGFLVLLAGTLTATHAWHAFLLYWVVPYLTWMQVCFHVRSIAEHFALPARNDVYGQTRTVLASLGDRVLLGTNNVNFHMEHHLYPSVPFYRLPQLHAQLMALPDYRRSVHLSRGYLAVLNECRLR